jgi:hypothetical protein
MHAERLSSHLPRQVKRLLWHTPPRQFQGILGHALLERRQHLRGRPKEPIGRHQPLDA